MTERREGHWRWHAEPDLPMPVPDAEWPGRDAFLALLPRVEAAARQQHYKGFSTCRICECVNGSSSYTLGGWEWPSGFMHYLKEHGVRPSAAFEAFVLDRGPRLPSADHKPAMSRRLPAFPPRGSNPRRPR